MTIKKFKEKVYLTDELTTEEYIIDKDSNIIEQDVHVENNNEIIPITELHVDKVKTKSKYNLFVTQKTNELKQTQPSLSAKERKVIVSEAWKLEKGKI